MEDVTYLKQNAVEDSYLFVVDSSMRNINAYESPSQYSIEFASPFTNVVGVELLNATIPRTQYAVEEPYNTLNYQVENLPARVATVPVGDYNLLQLTEALSEALDDGVSARPLSVPFKRTSRTVLECSAPFTLYANSSSMAKLLGFNNSVRSFSSTLTGTKDEVVYYGPYPGYDSVPLQPEETLSQPFTPAVTGPISKGTLFVENETVSFRVVDGDGTEYCAGQVTPDESNIVLDLTAANEPLLAGQTYHLELMVEGSNAAQVFVNIPRADSLPADGLEDRSVCGELFSGVKQHELISPGLCDLTGERHILIRCPEVESYIHLDRVHEKFHAGLGMVRLGIDGYQEQSFVGFPRRVLQVPIKLSRLSFRLEKPDGTLYNARGVDHVLVCVIHFLKGTPGQGAGTPSTPRMLNPEYTPELLNYMNTKWQREIDYRDVNDHYRSVKMR